MSLNHGKYLSDPEELRLMGTIERLRWKEPRNTAMLLFSLWTGARPSEVLHVRWVDIDFFEMTVFLKTMKGGVDRVIPFSQTLHDFLLEWRNQSSDQDLVFPISYRRFCNIWREYRPVRKKLHSLRHTFAVNLYHTSGHNVRIVQKALGHRNLATTAVYLDIEADIDEMRKFICNDRISRSVDDVNKGVEGVSVPRGTRIWLS